MTAEEPAAQQVTADTHQQVALKLLLLESWTKSHPVLLDTSDQMCIVFGFSQLLSLQLGIGDGRGPSEFFYDVVPPLLITVHGRQVLVNRTKHLAQGLPGF